MQDEIRNILERIAKERNLPLKTVIKIYHAPYIFARQKWSQIDFENPSSFEECNLYIIKLGTFFIRKKRVEAILKNKKNGTRKDDGQAES
jgi:hypothetical protein